MSPSGSPKSSWSRAEFLRFMGASSWLVASVSLPSFLANCRRGRRSPFDWLRPSSEDAFLLAEGLSYNVVVREGESLGAGRATFGKNNDYIAFLPDPKNDRSARLWVNHEYPVPLFENGAVIRQASTRAQADRMMRSVGGSFIKIEKTNSGWTMLRDGSNARFDANTPIRIEAPRPIAGSLQAIGTFGNCAGGVTPWGTVLTCEENHENYYGDFTPGMSAPKPVSGGYRWEDFYSRDPRHYGWVVEFDPRSGELVKHTALGRFSHESATVVLASDGRPVIYSGDDTAGGCLYKYIGDQPNKIGTGRLFAANIKRGRWEELNLARSELRGVFSDQLEVLIHARQAARLCSGTRLDRPEDIEVDPRNGQVYVALTNNVKRLNFYGSILRLTETGNDPLSPSFKSETFLSGGHDSGFACPDNMVFDPAGNLWLTSDISESYSGSGPYAAFKNNGLFYIPLRGRYAGEVYQVASAPRDAELTGPCFTPDGRTLFLSVQHPGIGSRSMSELTSHWPAGGAELPRSAVVAISGELLEKLIPGEKS